jgi:hypothetical protein
MIKSASPNKKPPNIAGSEARNSSVPISVAEISMIVAACAGPSKDMAISYVVFVYIFLLF